MIKFLSEIIPLLTFLIGYKTKGILCASISTMIAYSIFILINYFVYKKIDQLSIITTLILAASVIFALVSGNLSFIKMKPTIIYCLFSCILLVTQFKFKQPAIRYVLGNAIQLQENRCWYVLNLRFMVFFLVMACLNEIIWRNYDENIWVNFKVFGATSLTLVFTLIQIPFISKNQKT